MGPLHAELEQLSEKNKGLDRDIARTEEQMQNEISAGVERKRATIKAQKKLEETKVKRDEAVKKHDKWVGDVARRQEQARLPVRRRRCCRPPGGAG